MWKGVQMINSLNATAPLAKIVLDNPNHASFPDHTLDYFDRFTRIDDHLNKEVHPNINVGPTAREPIWLTDHGPEHITTVIRRAGELVSAPEQKAVTPYEAYILLLACHFHDVGNIFGRDEHEKKVRDVMFKLDHTLVGEDTLEKRMICDIAMAHGGFVDVEKENKDTIGALRYDRSTKPNGVDVKKLAAVLRFADELADDKTRTNRFVQEASRQSHPGSEIFHAYAAHLRPTRIDHDSCSVEVHFELNVDSLQRKYPKKEEDRFLFEEILDRTLKMHREHIYCSRFMLPSVLLERINVQIDVCTTDFSTVLAQIKYTMEPLGYPGSPKMLGEICPPLKGFTGELLAAKVSTLLSDAVDQPYSGPVDLLASTQEART
jgi:hypothetical protein